MNRYEPSNLRPLFGITAVAMTVLTIAASVVVPASLSPLARDDTALAKRVAPPTEVAISPARIDVIGVRETNVAATQQREATAKQKPRG